MLKGENIVYKQAKKSSLNIIELYNPGNKNRI